jgi:hypothetical protein
LGVPSIEKEESKNRGKQTFKKVHSMEGRGKKREKSFAAVVRVLYPKEEGAWVGTVIEYCLLKVANVRRACTVGNG